MNSRLRISNQFELAKEAQSYVARAADNGNRAVFILFRSPEGWLEEFARLCQCHYLSPTSRIDRGDRINAILGSERRISVVQLGKKPDLGLLAAAAGTVKAGGLLVIGTCAKANADRAILDFTRSSFVPGDSTHSNRRLEQLADLSAAKHPTIVRCVEVIADIGPQFTDENENKQAISKLDACLHRGEPRLPNPQALAEQNALFDQACNHIDSSTSSCIVIKGRRGRGKSSLLGRLAAHFDHTSVDFRITAMHESALNTYHQHTAHMANRYVSPESATNASVNVLLVDEAANVSLAQLQSYLDHFYHVILCTTIDGYEASGRALDVRLLSDWSRKSMRLLQLDVKHPWRWADNDPLEQFSDQLLLNKVTQQPDQIVQMTSFNAQSLADNCQLMRVSQNELVDNATLLASVHALLHTTHYQTTSKDLQHLLDAPTVQLWIQMLDRTVVGALVLEQEGAIDDDLHEAILQKNRRLPNQLLPQLLAQTADTPVALKKRYLRIIRLAVTARLRRHKLASQMLHAVTLEHTALSAGVSKTQKSKAVDAIGASFAADECSLEFWQSHGYTEFHRGFRSNPRTGKRAVAMMRGFDKTTREVLSSAADIHNDNELARQSDKTHADVHDSRQALSAYDIQLLQRFAAGQRSKHDTYAPLQRLATQTHIPMNRQPGLSARQHELELRSCVQQWMNIQNH